MAKKLPTSFMDRPLLTYSIPHLLSQFFWPDLLLHMATKQDRDSSSLKTDASPEKTAPVSIIILQPRTIKSNQGETLPCSVFPFSRPNKYPFFLLTYSDQNFSYHLSSTKSQTTQNTFCCQFV